MFKRGLGISGDLEPGIAWRIDRLRDAGFPAPLADAVAHDTRYDVHALLELTDQGCPTELAARILAPLTDECERAL
ncbi:MAG: hypothetical protein E6G34_11505 [Actinobacteria bacterium]|nr:MAG: hypothetical protein E6G34_11505 [Actinomycetota bacterium]